MEESNFAKELQVAVSQKQEWFNTIALAQLLEQYRLLHTCVKNLYETFVKKSLIVPDPYRLDKRISDIVLPETTPFTETEIPKVFGTRFSDYETMLDFICTYYRFSAENLPLSKVKKLMDFNSVFEWDNISTNNSRMNTRALAMTLANAKTGAAPVLQSLINDSLNKCAQTSVEIKKLLNELGVFQRELYKAELRKDLFEHPEFDKEKAYTSAEAEMAEIKRLYPKILGKKPFYSDLINEIIEEDLGADREKRQAAVLAKLQIKNAAKTEQKKHSGPDSKELLMGTVLAIGAFAPTLLQLHSKLVENFDLLFAKHEGFFAKLVEAFKKAFHMKEKERICTIKIKDPKSGAEKEQKINVRDFMTDLGKKARIYNGIGTKGPEYSKIESTNEDTILSFVNKQISEIQSVFTTINALDVHFKTNVEILLRPKVKGLQIELSALRNSIINANKKRGDYISFKEENEQMRKLGIKDENN